MTTSGRTGAMAQKIFGMTVAVAAAVLSCALPLAAAGNADAVITAALTMPPKDALRVMDSLSRTQNVPAPARARSLKFLGDHRFIKEDYKNAAEYYGQAARADSSSAYRHLYALALAMNGRAAQAADILRVIAQDKSDGMSAEAAQLVAQLGLPEPAPPPASSAPAASAPMPTPAPAPAAKPAPQTTTAGEPAAEIIFTIQVGAFGSKENADNLVKRLSGTYGDVTVSPTVSGDQTLYRVRVGAFKTRDDAAAFADRLVTGSGLSARVVEK